MRITMVGTGYVGLVTGTCFANTGNDVVCLDVNDDKIALLNDGQVPFYEPGLEEMVLRNVRAQRLQFTTDKTIAYKDAQVVFICVGTPSDDDGRADLRYVFGAAADIAAALEVAPDREPTTVVIKSTVPVGTNAKVAAAIASATRRNFTTASNPEFLKEGAAINDFLKPDRVVIGADNQATSDQLCSLYEPFVRQGNPILLMDIRSAEMVKYAANAMLATKISFINEIANLCEAYGADVDEVRRGMCADQRIGNQFLFPGLGYGGSCFPKDVKACVAMGAETATKTPLLQAVDAVNTHQRTLFVQKVLDHFAADAAPDAKSLLENRHVAVWGLAFKRGTDDVREAPSITIIRRLLEHGATVTAHDPVAEKAARRELGDAIHYAPDPLAAVQDADALVVCTDWDEYQQPDLVRMQSLMRRPVIFDGRNLYRPSMIRRAGFTYVSVGRGTCTSSQAPVETDP